jgi:hypothetical protein
LAHVHPRYLASAALIAFPIALVWLSVVITPEVWVWELLLPLALLRLLFIVSRKRALAL